jgi:hypothetical protein
LWLPPALLVALLIAGPVSAARSAPSATAGRAAVTHVPAAVRAVGTNPADCPVVAMPLTTTEDAGPAGAPEGPGTCLAPAPRVAPPADGTVVDPNAQAVTQSIGLAVRPGSSLPAP